MLSLGENILVSEYNEGTEGQIDYHLNLKDCKVGGKAYMFSHENDETTELEIVHIIRRSDDMGYYDTLSDDVLIEGESKYHADTSAEFVFETDCYLVWFKVLSSQTGAGCFPDLRENVMQKWKDAYHATDNTMIELLRSEEAVGLTKDEKKALLAWCGDDEYAFIDDLGGICLNQYHDRTDQEVSAEIENVVEDL